jgi:hypothetical protein
MSKQRELHPCIRCSKIPAENDIFCTDCGAPVQNVCSDVPGILRKGCTFVNSRTASYCAKCGEPTIYQLNGLIHPIYPSASKPSFINSEMWRTHRQ